MDEAYNRHSRRNKSATNIGYSSPMAPLSSRVSFIDADVYTETPQHNPADPPPKYSFRKPPGSCVHFDTISVTNKNPLLMTDGHRPILSSKSHQDLPSFSSTPTLHYKAPTRRNFRRPSPLERCHSDWMPRAGVRMAGSANEINGNAWMLSSPNDSFTTAPSPRLWEDLDENQTNDQWVESERRRELQAMSRRSSRPTSRLHSALPSAMASPEESREGSQMPSRAHSRVSFAGLASLNSDLEELSGSEHSKFEFIGGKEVPGPDFVEESDRLEAEAAYREYHGTKKVPQDEEQAIRRLVSDGTSSRSWVASVMGWQRDAEEMEENDKRDGGDQRHLSRHGNTAERHFQGVPEEAEDELPGAPLNGGVWSDAAWLLSVASKVIL